MTSLTSTKNIFTSCICSARSKPVTVKMPLSERPFFILLRCRAAAVQPGHPAVHRAGEPSPV